MRELTIEKKVTEYAEKRGWLSYKFTSPARRAVPDRIYMRRGAVFFIEFKAPGKTTSKAQLHEHRKIEDELIPVYVIDNIEDGCTFLDDFDY